MAIEYSWMEGAPCLSAGQLFFGPSGTEKKKERLDREEKAKAMCGKCALRKTCLNFALENRISHGIFGGMTAEERKRVLGQYIRS